MSFGLEKFDREAEIGGATEAGNSAAFADYRRDDGKKTTHTFTDKELVRAWENGYQEGLQEIKGHSHTINPVPNEPGSIEE